MAFAPRRKSQQCAYRGRVLNSGNGFEFQAYITQTGPIARRAFSYFTVSGTQPGSVVTFDSVPPDARLDSCCRDVNRSHA